ncbi:MAG: acetolactate synthase large subunit [Actinomycetota bacterium]
MNGAHALIRTLVANGVDVCFANPGTSEMQFVAALDDVPQMRAVLALFEGVATGAADGYARMADRPAATLLHLGPGLGNGIANLHNARRARTPIVNIVGDHATYHRGFDAPLGSDIETLARNVSGWIRDTTRPADVRRDAADAVAAALGPPGQVATMILPADTTWLEAGDAAPARAPTVVRREVSADVVDVIAKALRSGEPTALLLGGSALRERGLRAASRVAQAAAAKLLCEVFPARLERGAGLPTVERLGYFAEFAMAQLAGIRHLVLIDTKAPVSFFAYPDKPSLLVPDDCEVHVLAADADDAPLAMEHLADALGADADAILQPAVRPERPTGALSAQTVAEAIGAVLPEGVIVADEAQTGGLFVSGATAGVPRHDWLTLTGGSIGLGLPLATGAAVACPDRPVLCLQADGSAMYTLQALWTQAREGLDVTTVLFDNRSYAILHIELGRVGAGAGGPRARSLLDLSNPDLDFVALARGMGVDAARAQDSEDLAARIERAFVEPGPHVIVVPLSPRL